MIEENHRKESLNTTGLSELFEIRQQTQDQTKGHQRHSRCMVHGTAHAHKRRTLPRSKYNPVVTPGS